MFNYLPFNGNKGCGEDLKMDDDIAIKVDHVSKKYCKLLKSSMLYGVNDIARNSIGFSSHSERLRNGEFWAVNDVSFELRKGETLGIIGPNGSGKTTLLKMLNGIFWPDKGKISIKGKVGALIEVGAGFHPLLTGRENIYVNGAILGMSKKEIDEKFDDIVAFADIGDFLDSPVKTYSSGMYVRLGFAIAVHCKPEILIVDEILAVGDQKFHSKCYNWFSKRLSEGDTTIFVSHNTDIVRRLCSRCIVLNRGRMLFDGETDKAVDCYMNSLSSQSEQNLPKPNFYTPEIVITSASLIDKLGNELNTIKSGEDIIVEINCHAREIVNRPIVGIAIYNPLGILALAINSQEANMSVPSLKGNSRIRVRLIGPRLVQGYYTVQVALHHAESAALAYDLYKLPRIYQVQDSNCRRAIVDVGTEWFLNNSEP